MIKPNPFTPKSGLEPKVFLNRDKEIDFFLKRIKEAKQRKINHYIINGAWGSGKTSLLRYFKLIAQEKNCAASYFLARELPENSTDVEISAHLIQSIIRNIPYKLSSKSSHLVKIVKGFGFQVLGSGFNISFEIDKNKFIDAQIFLMDSLLNIWKDIKKNTGVLVVLIDDVQNYFRVQRIFTMLKNVLSDERIVTDTNILFLLSSTVEGWDPFIKMNHPIGRFFIPRMELQNFDKEEAISLVDSILKGTGVTFSDSVKNNIFKYTGGHLFQTHSLGSTLYDNQINDKVTDSEWEKGFEEGLFYLGNAVYDGIIKNLSENEIKVIEQIDPFKTFSAKSLTNLRIKGINVYLQRLTEKGILINTRRAEYKIADKLLCLYLKLMKNNRNNRK